MSPTHLARRQEQERRVFATDERKKTPLSKTSSKDVHQVQKKVTQMKRKPAVKKVPKQTKKKAHI